MSIEVRPLRESELSRADEIFRLAFGTHIGLDSPGTFAAGSEYVSGRWAADPMSALAATEENELVGTNFAVRWGRFAYFGPLTVDPRRWNGGVGAALVEAAVTLFDTWDVRLAGLYTFADSVKHVALYQRFGFWPRGLTLMCVKGIDVAPSRSATSADAVERLSKLDPERLPQIVERCGRLTERIYDGLDLAREIHAAVELGLGEVVLIPGTDDLEAFAVCHLGEGSEAGPGVAYVKFGAALSEGAFRRLLAACEALAASEALDKVLLGVNTARTSACDVVRELGYLPRTQGIAMHRPNHPGFSRPGVWVVDDWR